MPAAVGYIDSRFPIGKRNRIIPDRERPLLTKVESLLRC